MADDRRAAQIAAVRDVMGWAVDPDSEVEQATADLAAELVDAVTGVSPKLVIEINNMPKLTEAELDELKRRFLATAHLPAVVLPEPTPDQLAEAERRGYAQAVAALRDFAGYKRWHEQEYDRTGVDHHRWHTAARQVLADYLEATGPQPAGDALTPAQDVTDG